MKNNIVIDFKNVVSELESKKLKLCFIKNRGMFLEDTQGDLYSFEISKHGSYLDSLIKDGTVVQFNYVNPSLSRTIEDFEKEVWGVSEVNAFIKRHSL